MTETNDTDGGYELRHYLGVLWRRKLSILAPIALLALAGWLLGSGLTTSYTSTAEVLAKPIETGVSSTGAATKDEALIGDEIAILSSDEVEKAVEDKVGHEVLPEITQEIADSNVITITVTGEEGDVQADAQAYADTYVAQRRAELAQGNATALAGLTPQLAEVDAQIAALAPQITALDASILAEVDEIALRKFENSRAELVAQRDALTVSRTAIQQQIDGLELTAAVNPTLGIEVLANASEAAVVEGATKVQYASAGAALGLILGVLLAFAREHFDQSLRTTRDVEMAGRGVRLLGVVPRHTRGATL